MHSCLHLKTRKGKTHKNAMVISIWSKKEITQQWTPFNLNAILCWYRKEKRYQSRYYALQHLIELRWTDTLPTAMSSFKRRWQFTWYIRKVIYQRVVIDALLSTYTQFSFSRNCWYPLRFIISKPRVSVKTQVLLPRTDHIETGKSSQFFIPCFPWISLRFKKLFTAINKVRGGFTKI